MKATMLFSEILTLAGLPQIDRPDKAVIVKYKPETKSEARYLLKIFTYYVDARPGGDPDYHCYAGFTDAELLQGDPGVIIGKNSSRKN
jgi:hypothetical protein